MNVQRLVWRYTRTWRYMCTCTALGPVEDANKDDVTLSSRTDQSTQTNRRYQAVHRGNVWSVKVSTITARVECVINGATVSAQRSFDVVNTEMEIANRRRLSHNRNHAVPVTLDAAMCPSLLLSWWSLVSFQVANLHKRNASSLRHRY